jgi:hypothetical protein
MLSIYILEYKLISFKKFKIVSPATFENEEVNCWYCRMSDEHQQHLRSRLNHVSVNNWNYTEYIQVVPH